MLVRADVFFNLTDKTPADIHCKLVINHGTGWRNSHKHKRVKNDKIGSGDYDDCQSNL